MITTQKLVSLPRLWWTHRNHTLFQVGYSTGQRLSALSRLEALQARMSEKRTQETVRIDSAPKLNLSDKMMANPNK